MKTKLILALLLALVLGAAHPSHAADFAELVKGLGTGSFSDKASAAEELGAAGDSRAIPALEALTDGRLVAHSDGRVAIEADGKLLDAVTGAPLQGSGEGFDKVRVNNRLRSAVEGALSRLQLFSDKRGDRLNAARDALKNPSAEMAALLDRALGQEKDPQVRDAMQNALMTARIVAGSPGDRIIAINALADSNDPQVRNLLLQTRDAADTPAEVKAAIESSLAAMGRRQLLIEIAQNLFQGLSLGSVLLLAAIGLAVTFGVMGVINMAHGEMIMIGAYTAYVVQELFRAYVPPVFFGWYIAAAVPMAFVAAALVGIAIERSIIRFLYGRPLETMLATWGISLMLQQAVRTVFGAPNKEVANPDWMTGGITIIGDFAITWNRLYIIIFCFAVLGLLAILVQRSAFGLHMRAVTQNRGMAGAMGIATARVDALTFGLGSGIAGVAGVALSQIGNVSPNLGQIYIVDSFLVVVFGGVGNLMGTLVGALTLGVVNKIMEPVAGAVLGKVLVLVAIILFIQKRPRGLFALSGRAAES